MLFMLHAEILEELIITLLEHETSIHGETIVFRVTSPLQNFGDLIQAVCAFSRSDRPRIPD
jgi:hypothetical protein